jgi:hypothetical protein
MRLVNFLQEEFYKYVAPKYFKEKKGIEVYENPSLSELKEIDRQFRESYYQYLLSNNNKSAEYAKKLTNELNMTIRFIFFPFKNTDFPTNKWFAASAALIHDEFDVGGLVAQIRAAGTIYGDEVKIIVLGDLKNRYIVNNIMKKTGMRYQII